MKKILFLSLLPIISFAQSDISNFWKNDSWHTDQIITHKSNSFSYHMLYRSDINNFWKHDSWRTDQIITHKSNSFHIYGIVKQDSRGSRFNHGTFLSFNADGTFSSGNTAPLGYDCFRRSYGTFKKIDETHIQLQINLFSQEGTCISVTDTIRQNLGIFEIKPNEYGYQLIKTNN